MQEDRVYLKKKGKTAKITTKLILQDNKKKLLSKGHGAKLRYSSTNKAVAVVTAKGTIRAKRKKEPVISMLLH